MVIQNVLGHLKNSLSPSYSANTTASITLIVVTSILNIIIFEVLLAIGIFRMICDQYHQVEYIAYFMTGGAFLLQTLILILILKYVIKCLMPSNIISHEYDAIRNNLISFLHGFQKRS
jgi:L-cystine uptake protein TcyP (sodium:dicarboxylate symporter family)